MIKKDFHTNFPGKGPNALWILLCLIGLGVAYLVWYNNSSRDVEFISYSKLVTAVEANNVDSVVVQGQHAQGKYKNNKVFETYLAPTPTVWELFKQHNVTVDVYPVEKESWNGYLLFLILFVIAMGFIFYLRQSQANGGSSKIFSVGKSKARFFSPNTVNVSFKDVAGNEEAKEDLKDIVEFLKNPDHFSRLGAKIPRGILLTGAPGNGKTLLAKAVAGEANCPFLSISGSSFVEVFVGVGASRVRDLFAQARKNGPCIVFIDEIDAVGRQRGVGLGGGNDEREQTLNQLLEEMDGFSTEQGAVIVLAATNRPDVLDSALLRPGRFDRSIEVPFPDLSSREQILQVHVRKVKLDSGVDLHKIARGTPGFSGADLENLINEAALLASKHGETSVSMKYFEIARDKIMLGSERKTLVFTEKDKLMTAYHEAGHTLLNVLLPETDPLHKVTIVPRGRALGVSWSLPERDKYSQNKEEILGRMVVCFGGMISEKMNFNTQTSGCSDDIEKATKMARVMVCRYGMSDLGPIVFDNSQEHAYLGREMQGSRDYSEKTAQQIDEAVDNIIQECYQRGLRLLTENKDKLELLAKTLFEKETLMAKEVYELLDIQPRENHALHEEN